MVPIIRQGIRSEVDGNSLRLSQDHPATVAYVKLVMKATRGLPSLIIEYGQNAALDGDVTYNGVELVIVNLSESGKIGFQDVEVAISMRFNKLNGRAKDILKYAALIGEVWDTGKYNIPIVYRLFRAHQLTGGRGGESRFRRYQIMAADRRGREGQKRGKTRACLRL